MFEGLYLNPKSVIVLFICCWQGVSVLRSIYPSVDEVDLFIGAVAEKPLKGALLGPTFVCLVGDQFARLRRGDRFFYEEAKQPSTFTEGK